MLRILFVNFASSSLLLETKTLHFFTFFSFFEQIKTRLRQSKCVFTLTFHFALEVCLDVYTTSRSDTEKKTAENDRQVANNGVFEIALF